MKLNYEEKQYETFFNQEIRELYNVVVDPTGQVAENLLGYDASTFINDPVLRKRLQQQGLFLPIPYQSLYRIEKFLGILSNAHDIKVNMLLQYKRPEFISSKLGKAFYYWNKPYFKYNIYTKQQILLEKIYNKFKKNILIIYASPKITDIQDLRKNAKNREIIKNSNLCEAYKLTNHKQNTYTSDSRHSKAFSTPETIESLNLMDSIRKIRNTDNQFSLNNLEEFTQKIKEVLFDDAYFSEIFQRLELKLPSSKEYPILHSMLFMRYFQVITGINWAWSIDEKWLFEEI